MFFWTLSLLFAAVLSALETTHISPSNALIINEFHVKFDLTSQTPIEVYSLRVTNKSPQQIDTITILIPVERTVVGSVAEDAYGQPLTFTCSNKIAPVTVDEKRSNNFRICEIKTGNPIGPEYEFKVAMLKIYYKNFYNFSPRSINLFEDQKAKITVYKVPASPYKIEKASLDMSYGEPSSAKTEKSENSAVVSPLSPVSTILHFVINMHFVESEITKRYIEISHWGNVYFKDLYMLHNRAAKLRGPYSTIDFNKGRKDTGRNAFKQETIRLPETAWGLFYRDEIGNISTSTVKRESDHISVTLKPRFSLLGDWNCTWELSFNVPTNDILKTHAEEGYYRFEYKLNHLLENTPSDKYELSIALPEGATAHRHMISTTQPYTLNNTLSFSYLDFLGRPTLQFTFENFLPRVNPDATVIVDYSLPDGLLFIEPLYLVAGLMLCFSIYLVLSKLDLSFGSEDLQALLKVHPSYAHATAVEQKNTRSAPKRK